MKTLKSNPLLRLVNSHVRYTSEHSHVGSLLGFGLGSFYLLPFYFKHFSSEREMKSGLTLDFWRNNLDSFYQWFVGFTEAEGCFKVKPKYRDGKSIVHSFYFEFEIHLHIDEIDLLYFINSILGIGKVYKRESSNSCSFIIGNEKSFVF